MNKNDARIGRPTVYPSIVDRWLVIVLVLPFFLSLAIGVAMWTQDRLDEAFVIFLVGAAVMVLTALVTVPCRYTLNDDHLHIRCGVFYFQRVEYSRIRDVRPSKSILSAPALSLDRVAVVTPSKSYLVSPRPKQEFIDELRGRAGLETSGQ